jgi:hypothetical protein
MRPVPGCDGGHEIDAFFERSFTDKELFFYIRSNNFFINKISCDHFSCALSKIIVADHSAATSKAFGIFIAPPTEKPCMLSILLSVESGSKV